MNPRFALTVLLGLSLVLLPLSMAASAAPAFAQQQGDQEDSVEEERDETPSDEDQEDAGAEDDENGAGAAPGEEEEGPPWTYQMARLSLAALAGLGLAVGAAYYRFVILRRRGYV